MTVFPWKGGRLRRALGWTLAALTLTVGLSDPVAQLRDTPQALSLTRGETLRLSYWMPLRAEVDDQQVLSSLDQRLDGVSSLALTGQQTGTANMILRLLGVPVKTVRVTVAPERTVVPGGQSIGVALAMSGVLVVGASDVGTARSPAREAGLYAGDLIVAINGEQVASAKRMSELIAPGKPVTLSVERAGRALTMEVAPVRDSRDGAYRLGAWVRDSTVGVGTLTFVDRDSLVYGALGHAITDADTGAMLSVANGSIYESAVVDVQPGVSGTPGELMGEFGAGARLGDVSRNTSFGLYGTFDASLENALYPDGLPTRTRSEVTLGAAQILCTVGGDGVRAYDCEITRLYRQESPAQRGMAIRITDQTLLEKAGGIVQGMSGSPILQNGCVVGAVTHVFVNDPTQGYGMYIDWMLAQAEEVAKAQRAA